MNGMSPQKTRFALRNNVNHWGTRRLSNLQLTNQQKIYRFPGGPVLFDDSPRLRIHHWSRSCQHA